MIPPSVAAGVEETCNLLSPLVESSYVWTFISIAPRAGQAEIIELRLAMVLLSDYVINFETQTIGRLREQAILAESLRPPPDTPV
jgi:hypothetical protein